MASEIVHVGISGHRHRVGADWAWVSRAICEHIQSLGEVIGFSSLATGADQVFAETVLDNGGRLVAVVPNCEGLPALEAGNEAAFERFRALAAAIIPIEAPTADEAFVMAGRRVVDLCDRMIFVWDGGPSRGAGGTADVVAYAAEAGTPGIILDPIRKIVRPFGNSPARN